MKQRRQKNNERPMGCYLSLGAAMFLFFSLLVGVVIWLGYLAIEEENILAIWALAFITCSFVWVTAFVLFYSLDILNDWTASRAPNKALEVQAAELDLLRKRGQVDNQQLLAEQRRSKLLRDIQPAGGPDLVELDEGIFSPENVDN